MTSCIQKEACIQPFLILAFLTLTVLFSSSYSVVSAPPFVSLVEPPDASQASANSTLEYQITESDTEVVIPSIALKVNCNTLSPAISKAGFVTTIQLAAPPTGWPQGVNNVDLGFRDTSNSDYEFQYTFVVDGGSSPTVDLVADSVTWNSTIGGLDITYSIVGGPLLSPTVGTLFWADGPDISNELPNQPPILSFPINSTCAFSEQIALHAPASAFASPPSGATYVLLVLDPNDLIEETDKSNNMLAAPIQVCLSLTPIAPAEPGPTSPCFANLWPPWSSANSTFMAATLSASPVGAFLVLSNCGVGPITLTRISITGEDSNEFYPPFPPLTGVSEFDTMQPGDSRIYSVTYQPFLPDDPGCKYAVFSVFAEGLLAPVTNNLDALAFLTPASIQNEAIAAENAIAAMSLSPGSPALGLLTNLKNIIGQMFKYSDLVSEDKLAAAEGAKTAAVDETQAFLHTVGGSLKGGTLTSSQATELTGFGNVLTEFIKMLP